MNPVTAQQVALNNALVDPEKRLKIEKFNARIEFSKPQRETTYQFTLDALKLSPCYPTFLITADVPEELGYTGKCDMPYEIHTDHMHQPWRTFDVVINRCISEKSTRVNRLRPSRAQILWGMFYQKNVDYVALQWEDFMFQVDNREIRFAHNLHIVRDDTLLGTLKFVSKTKDYQKYGALIPKEMINQAIKDSKAYKIYLDFVTKKATPKKARKFKKNASPSQKLTIVLEEEHAKKPKRAKKPKPVKQAKIAKKAALAKKSSTMQTTSVVIRDTPGVSVSKTKAQAKVDRGKCMDLLFDVTLLETAQLKKVLKKSKQDTHMLHASGSDDGVGSQPKVLDELKEKKTGTNEGTGTIPGVPDVPKDQSESENENEQLYGDLYISLNDVEPADKEKGDVKMTNTKTGDAELKNVNQKKTTLFETRTKSMSFNKIPTKRALHHALMDSILEDEDAMDEGVADKLKKRKHDDADKDEGPFARSDRGLKRQKIRKDTEPPKKAKSTETPKGTSKGTPKS
nr:hypothetical protein [Tanacetum cinerariifolium]